MYSKAVVFSCPIAEVSIYFVTLHLTTYQESKNQETINLAAYKIISLFRPRVWRLPG